MIRVSHYTGVAALVIRVSLQFMSPVYTMVSSGVRISNCVLPRICPAFRGVTSMDPTFTARSHCTGLKFSTLLPFLVSNIRRVSDVEYFKAL